MNLLHQSVDALDTPQLLLDLDILDANYERMASACKERGVDLRVHFKSLKCGGLAKYLMAKGVTRFLCAKLNEALVLADAGVSDILIANQVVGSAKMAPLADLAKRVQLRVCVDDAQNVADLSKAMHAAGVTLGVLVEVDVGMRRCGVLPGEPALELARRVADSPGLRFDGLQGYDGHLQLLADPIEKKAKALEGLEALVGTRRLIEKSGLPVKVVTGAGTGTWEYAAGFPGVSEIQPGSFLLMDCAYHQVRPEFGCALSILATVGSRRDGWYVLNAGSKAISQDFGSPTVKNHAGEKVLRLAEEHSKVEADTTNIKVGDRREVIPAHCCATMNLHRQCLGIRKGKVETVWDNEASGRYW